MDKEFEKKIRQKRMRAIVIGVIVLAAIIYLLVGTKVEKADYTASLEKEIKTAQSLFEESKGHIGNGKEQYANYTIRSFEKQIAAAEYVLNDKEREYTQTKRAYETLKDHVDAFKKGKNSPVIEAEEIKVLIAETGNREVSTEIKEGKRIKYFIAGESLEEAVTMNLMAREEGPYYDEIQSIMETKKLQGQVISFYQDGTFGGSVEVEVPFDNGKMEKCYVYEVNVKKGAMEFAGEAVIDLEAHAAHISISKGGDYVLLTEPIHQKSPSEQPSESSNDEDADENMTAMESSIPDIQQENDENDEPEQIVEEKETESEEEPSGENQKQPATEKNNIIVSIEIRCDTLAKDLSQLTDPALEAYVPADGIILSLDQVEVEKGVSVYDVLDLVCRNKGIHMEAVYTPSYGADYIEGINYLYEFDAGEQSGWMFKVNGVFPNYGCSDYILEDGDAIVWAYTCDMGKDLGN